MKVQGQPEHKVNEISSQQISWTWWGTSVMSAMWKASMGGTLSQANSGQKFRKNN
jgi:hypothetical protein